MGATLDGYLAEVETVQGWFPPGDRLAFLVFGQLQAEHGVRGNLLEIGAFFGKSAIMLGFLKRPDETLVVCDLFEDPAPDALNRRENIHSYQSRSLTRAAFEENYLRFHAELPRVEQRPSGELGAATLPAPMRFVHIDGSHIYEHVWSDLMLSRELLGDNSVVVIDDYRSAHTPGVAAATWQAIMNENFQPLCLTGQKMYGTWRAWNDDLVQHLHQKWADTNEMKVMVSKVGHRRFLRLVPKGRRTQRRAVIEGARR